MPNTVLGKVTCTPKGDYAAGTSYEILDIVGYGGGSYMALKNDPEGAPSNDGVNWMQLSGPGLPGVDGVTFTPSVSEAGVISWTNDGEEENPDPVDIMGPPGTAAGFGTVTATADNTSSETPSVDVQSSGPDTAKNFTFAFSGLKGKPGETPDIEIGTVTTLEPGQDATADITGTTPNLTLSLGIPKGQPGTSVSRIERTSGTGAPGTTDTYTMYDSNDDAIGTFTVYNGANGAGAGDFMADGSVPMTGPLNMGGNKVANLGAPGADTDAVRKQDLDAVAAEVDGILDGTTPAHLAPATETKIGGVIIGEGLSVTEDGTVSAETPSAADVGAVPTSRTVNGKALSSNITLTAADVGAGPGKRTARFTVGTSTAGWTTADCDYLCDGTDDQVEINAAIQALPPTGGEVVILDGTYNITAAISVDKDNVKLSGNGAATVLKRMWNSSTEEGVINIVAINGNCTVESLLVDGNSGGFNSTNNIGIYIFKESSAGGFLHYSSNNTINKCICKDSDSGIRISGDLTHNNTVTGNTCSNNSYGIQTGLDSSNNTITGNTCNNNGTAGIQTGNGSSNNTIT